MGKFLIRSIVNGVALVITSQIVSGIATRSGLLSVLIIGVVFGIINAIIRPIVKLLSLPLIIVTLGLFILVVNALMLLLTSAILPDYLYVAGFWPAVLGGIVMGIINAILEAITGTDR